MHSKINRHPLLNWKQFIGCGRMLDTNIHEVNYMEQPLLGCLSARSIRNAFQWWHSIATRHVYTAQLNSFSGTNLNDSVDDEFQ